MNHLDRKERWAQLNSEAAWRLARWSFAVVLSLFALVPVLHFLRGHSMKDYILWYDTGQLVLRGAEVYPNQWHKFPFMYPPSCALFLAPLSAFGKTGLILALVLVNAAAWICSIVFSVQLATGERGRRPHLLLYVVPNFVVLAFVWGNFLLGQPSLLLLALMLGAFLALWRRHQVLAGVLIALAAAIKAFPVLGLIYLLYRRYWVASAALVLTLAFLLLAAPVPFRGYALMEQDLQRWANGMLKYDETGIGQRTGRSYSWRNQSIWGVANRLLRHVEYDPSYAVHTPVYANLADLDFKTVNQIILAAGFLLGLIFIGVMPERARRTWETDAIEFALLLLLILIFTPMSFGYLFAWLLYPLIVVVQRLLARPNRGLLIWSGAAVLLLSLSIPLRIPAQTYGNTLLATVLLFVGLALELFRLKREDSGRIAGPQREAGSASGHLESSVTSGSRDL